MQNPVRILLLFFVFATCLLRRDLSPAQNLSVLHTFSVDSGVPYWTNYDGTDPCMAELAEGQGVLYGATIQGGLSGKGTIYRINMDGSDFKVLYNFPAANYFGGFYTNADGATCQGGLILADGVLLGTTSSGGVTGRGTIFAINVDGTGFTNLHSFARTDGTGIKSGLVFSQGKLFGTSYSGGSWSQGSVFALNRDGSDYAVLHTFTGATDGGSPPERLIIASNILYGVCAQGGIFGNGTVFAVNTDGTGFTNLYHFTSGSTNTDGARPHCKLTIIGNTLYGTASYGGSFGNGTMFKVNTDGSGFTNLYSFGFRGDDGVIPGGHLTVSGDTLLGTTPYGGSSGRGTVFAVKTNGTDFITLYNFTPGVGSSLDVTNTDGRYPWGVILSGGKLYGASHLGGSWARGTLFSLSIAPKLSIGTEATNLVLTWPENYAGFECAGFIPQVTTNIVEPKWTAISSPPVLVNGNYIVTNSLDETQRFFRLVR